MPLPRFRLVMGLNRRPQRRRYGFHSPEGLTPYFLAKQYKLLGVRM